MPHRPSAYLTTALRSRLIHAAVTEKNAPDLLFLLEELGLEPPSGHSVAEMTTHFQTCLARLARQPEQEPLLLRCCEGLAQFCLLSEASEQLQQLNTFLPEGLTFSLKSGRLIMDPVLFNAPDNPFLQESLRLVAELPQTPVQTPAPPLPTRPQTPVAPPTEPLPLQEDPPPPPEDRQQQRQRIIQQRIHRLKHQLTGRSGL